MRAFKLPANAAKKEKKKGNFGGFLCDDDIIEGKKCHAMAFPKKAKTFYCTFFAGEHK